MKGRVLVIGLDVSKSASPYLSWQVESTRFLVEKCLTNSEDREYSILLYSEVASPLIEPTTDKSKAEEALSQIELIKGVPEPIWAVKEAVETIYSYGMGLPGRSKIILFWSMAKKPRYPVSLIPAMVEAVGAELVIVSLQYAPPRWSKTHPLPQEIRQSIVYRRRLKPADIPKRVGCTSRRSR
ncbi:MAG: hypothetical protein F7C35_06800 [Desulfurococcales archaeon]|nr:hypothetical protein [Desulfurococcales archaeon]